MKDIAQKLIKKELSLAVIGLGYVGLPIAVAFARKGVNVIGFDISKKKIESLRENIDVTNEITADELIEVKEYLSYTDDPNQLRQASFIIVAVPTPVDENKTPDLAPVISASRLIGKNLNKEAIIVYESTVYPGVTEEVCIPNIEKASGFSWNNGDFFIGYSPERINPGDKEHTLARITKIVSGQNDDVCDSIADVYKIVVDAGVFKAENIKVAEAAKVIENTQRDLNIALMNELAIIFNKIGISTEAVLKAAGTKWNFLKFYPGLVGGHCIGVDPYYLTSKAEQLGYHPQVVLAGRRINDSMGGYIAQQTVKQMIKVKKTIEGANILILGLTFKENVPDFRNSRVVDIIHELKDYNANLVSYDPYAKDCSDDLHEFDVKVLGRLDQAVNIDAIVVATPHTEFKEIKPKELFKLCRQDGSVPVLTDVKWLYSQYEASKAGFHYWRL